MNNEEQYRCPHCSIYFQAENIEQHYLECEAQYKEVFCSYCQQSQLAVQIEEHYTYCPILTMQSEQMISCPYCKENILIQYMDDHYNECLIKMIDDAEQSQQDEGQYQKIEAKIPEIRECPICLIELAKEDEIGLLNCCHVFHKECLEAWFAKNNLVQECPTCRYKTD